MQVALAESDYVTVVEGVGDVIFLGEVKYFMPNLETYLVLVMEDKQGRIKLPNDPFGSKTMTHIDVTHHFLQGLVQVKPIHIV